MDSSNLRWQELGKPITFLFCIKSWNNSIRLDRMNFLEFYKEDEEKRIIIGHYNKRKYKIKLGSGETGKMLESG